MTINFVTPTRISLINLTTIGDSEKRDDPEKIGQFSSGHAYAVALLLRNSIDVSISVFGGVMQTVEGVEEQYVETYKYGTKEIICDSTKKSKEVITINYLKQYCRDSEELFIETAFALKLGYDWELWMAYRELMSNVLDEGGYVIEGQITTPIEKGTVIIINFDDNNPFKNIWDNRHLYMNFNNPLYVIDSNLEVLENKESYLRIYKQNILVYEDKNIPSKFAWNIKFGELDERRILRNIYSIEQEISNKICLTNNESFLKEIIQGESIFTDKEFLNNNGGYYNASGLMNKIATEVYEQNGSVFSYDWVIDKIKERKDCKIAGKKITTIQDSLWSYSRKVTIDSIPETVLQYPVTPDDAYENPLGKSISNLYNFKLDVEVKKASLKGSKVVADKYENCLIVDDNFNPETDFEEFIVQYVDLKYKGNVVTNMAKYIINLIKR